MLKHEISKTYYQKLLCQIYILGSPAEGESILFIVYGDDQIIYSCITDSFTFDDINIPKSILQKQGLDHVTEIFWTHPHDDHSDGLIELIESFKPEYVYIPSDLLKLPDKIPQISKGTLDTINTYHSCDGRYGYQPCIVDIGTNYTVLKKSLTVSGKEIPFCIYTIAPAIGKVRRDVITDNYSRLNDFSIAISIVIGDFSLLLTGDIQDQMIKYVSNDLEEILYTPNLLKIPHHGSSGSLDIMTLFDHSIPIDVAVTTSKKSSHLPKTDALDYYSPCCDRIYKISNEAHETAIWGIEIDILNATITEIEHQNYTLHTNN